MLRAVFWLSLAGCNAVAFNSELTGEAVVPAGAGMLAALPALSSLTDIDLDRSAEFKGKMVTRSQTLFARVDGATAKVLTPGADFTFLDQLQLVARSGSVESVFAEATDIASQPDKTSLKLKLLPPNTDITGQAQSNTMSIVMRGVGRQPMIETKIEVTVTLHVQASR